MYKVQMQRFCGSPAVTLIKTVLLPFVPTTDMELGLEEDSDFESDCYEITQVMWHMHGEMFLVRLEDSSIVGAVPWLLARGWTVDLGAGWDDIDQVIEYVKDFEGFVVEIAGVIYPADDGQMAALQMGPEPFRTVYSAPGLSEDE